MLNQFLKFSLVGAMNTAIQYGVFFIAYQFLDLYHLLAVTIGFCFAVSNSYVINKRWTFKAKTVKKDHQLTKFMIINLVTLSLNLTSMALLVEHFNIDPRKAQLASIGLTLSINFAGNKFWAFKKKDVIPA